METNARLLRGLSDARWRPDATAPEGIAVENLRRRGIDRLRLTVSGGAKKGLLARLFSGAALPPQTIVFADQKLHLEIAEAGKAPPRIDTIPYADVQSLTLAGTAGRRQWLKLQATGRCYDVGGGLAAESLAWLRDRIMLEVAGLVWKPVYNVGRRTTRATTTEADDTYSDWSLGAPNTLIEAFLAEAPEKASGLETALAATNWPAVKKNVHWLKSSCASVGAAQLSELCQRMEIEIEINDISRMKILAEKFGQEFASIVATLNRIRLTSSPGDTSTAPAVSGEQATDPATTGLEQPRDLPLSGTRVLVVEDSKVNQLLARDYLEDAGADVMTASDGQEAIDVFVGNVFDVIFMDCQMPVMDGRDATRIIRQREIETMRAMTPVVALTAHALPDDRALCLAAGMNDYMSKPYTRDEIIAMSKWWSGKNPDVPHETEHETEQSPAAQDAA